MGLEMIILNEVSHTEKDKYHVCVCVCVCVSHLVVSDSL